MTFNSHGIPDWLWTYWNLASAFWMLDYRYKPRWCCISGIRHWVLDCRCKVLSWIEKGSYEQGSGVKITILKTTETADQRSRELMNSGPTAGEPARDQSRPSQCRWQLCGYIDGEGPGSATRTYTGCMKWLFWAHSLWWDILLKGEGLDPVSTWYTRLCWFPTEEWMVSGRRGRWEGWRGVGRGKWG